MLSGYSHQVKFAHSLFANALLFFANFLIGKDKGFFYIKVSHHVSFCSHTTKRRCDTFLFKSKVSPQHLQSQTEKAHTLWYEHSLAYCCDC